MVMLDIVRLALVVKVEEVAEMFGVRSNKVNVHLAPAVRTMPWYA